VAAFASNSLLCRAALEGGHADAATFTLLRLLSGALVLCALARVREAPLPPSRWARGSAIALLAYALGFSLAYLRVPAGVGALLLFAAVQLTMVGGGLRAGERPRAREWTGLAVSLAGLGVLARPGEARPDLVGSVLMLAAGAAWGVYSLRGRRGGDPVGANAASFARAAPLALFAGLAVWGLGAGRLTPRGALLAALSGGVASGLFYAVWYEALRGLTAARAALVQLAVPVLAALGGVLLLGERLGPRLLLAGGLVLGGIALAVQGASAGRVSGGARAATVRISRDPERERCCGR
jgi:drug/metabolite transporter (DMT)-like permease